MNELNVQQKVGVQVLRRRPLVDVFQPKGLFSVDHMRAGELLARYEFPNGVTTVGKNHALDVVFGGTTQVSEWYIGMINGSGFTSVSATDTMSSHAGWTEFTSYSNATRLAWTDSPTSSGSKTSASTADFTYNATGTLKGIFIASDNTKGGTTGTLWATALFSSDIGVVNTDILKITYTVAA